MVRPWKLCLHYMVDNLGDDGEATLKTPLHEDSGELGENQENSMQSDGGPKNGQRSLDTRPRHSKVLGTDWGSHGSILGNRLYRPAKVLENHSTSLPDC